MASDAYRDVLVKAQWLRHIAYAFVIVAGLTGPAWADFDSGWAAFEQGDYGAAYKEFKRLAGEGDPGGLFGLAILYHGSNYVSKNLPKPFELYKNPPNRTLSEPK